MIPKNSDTYKRLTSALPPDVKAIDGNGDHWVASMSNAILANPKLAGMLKDERSRNSIINESVKAASLGLTIGVHAYLIPQSGASVRMQIDYKGILKIWRSDKESWVGKPEVVYAKDPITIFKGSRGGKNCNELSHTINPAGDRGAAIGYYIQWSHRGIDDFLYISEVEMSQHIKKNVSSNSQAWRDHPLQMRLKTVVRIAAAWGNVTYMGLPLSAFDKSINIDGGFAQDNLIADQRGEEEKSKDLAYPGNAKDGVLSHPSVNQSAPAPLPQAPTNRIPDHLLPDPAATAYTTSPNIN